MRRNYEDRTSPFVIEAAVSGANHPGIVAKQFAIPNNVPENKMENLLRLIIC
jgi:hypothetical protein